MKRIPCYFLALCLSLPLSGFPVETAQNTLTEWVRVQTLLSEEKADWQAERVIIKDMITLLQSEKNRLQETIASAQEDTSDADARRAELETERSSYMDAVAGLKDRLPELEAAARELYAWFPQPLQDELKPLYMRLPEDSAKTRQPVSQRTQTVVGILSQAEKFNSGFTLISEIKEMDDGRSTEVQTLYAGLGIAYFVDAGGTYAGIGYPTETGWQWEPKPEHSTAIRNAIAIYRNTREAAFVELPVILR